MKPYEYLKYILEKTCPTRHRSDTILLPWSKEIPCHCKLKEQTDSTVGDNDESCDHASDAGVNDLLNDNTIDLIIGVGMVVLTLTISRHI